MPTATSASAMMRNSATIACRSSRSTSIAPKSAWAATRSEEHTSELQSLMRISYAVFCLKKKLQSQLNLMLSTRTFCHEQHERHRTNYKSHLIHTKQVLVLT